MSCAACAAARESPVNGRGVHSARVNLLTEKAALDYDPDQIDLDTLLEHIEAGLFRLLKGRSIKPSIEYKWHVLCRLFSPYRKPQSMDGIANASVNLATNRAQLAYDPTRTGSRDIIAAIASWVQPKPN